MQQHIRHRAELQALECTVCKCLKEIPRKTLAEPEEFTAMRERFERAHEHARHFAKANLIEGATQ